MKYLAIIITLILGMSVLNAQSTHNPLVPSEEGNVIVKVITPLTIENDQGNANDAIPDVVKGTSRTFDPGEVLQLFKMGKETNYKVRFTLNVTQNVGGVALDADWYFTEEDPSGNTGTFTWNNPLNQSFDWFDDETVCWIALVVNGVNAEDQSVTTGTKTFDAMCSGYYYNL